MNPQWTILPTLSIALLYAFNSAATEPNTFKQRLLTNATAYIPPQCYTQTTDEHGQLHNPCYSCHTASLSPNKINDDELQLTYAFPLSAEDNPWHNLFQDRQAQVAAISDDAILTYIRQSNYFDSNGNIIPAARLNQVPIEWDYDENGRWDGFIPDAQFQFDNEGFDRTPDNQFTGWRSFAYYPFLGTFWPTNGSTDDVLIRLPDSFRRDVNGNFDLTVYKVNLAIVEALITTRDIPIEPVDEAALGGIDLDHDGQIGRAELIKYDWAPRDNRYMWYVGQALIEQRTGRLHLAARLYPEGTEFLHTVRYIDVNEQGENQLAARMKEVRYARKQYWMTYADLDLQTAAEIKEQHDFPDRIRTIHGNLEAGVSNDQGWVYAAMIEDAEGQLRPQNYEELVFCIGCHSGIGAITDGSFAFPRKLPATTAWQRGWYHWDQRGLTGIPDRARQDGQLEYTFYLQTNGAGDEFRSNDEIKTRFFDANHQLNPAQLEQLRTDISVLLAASPERAMTLNKAYQVIVREQSFISGRDATVTPLTTVHRSIDAATLTGIKDPVVGY
ncbi:hypothetical protein [Thiospirillum jenense]|uniref:hypothetical protein n=1 Tax=Thiospirillum jenense TaxID=1653858 RepID=UPI001EEA9B3B|nr:hypothetical protein [Thiospirillum jenense]